MAFILEKKSRATNCIKKNESRLGRQNAKEETECSADCSSTDTVSGRRTRVRIEGESVSGIVISVVEVDAVGFAFVLLCCLFEEADGNVCVDAVKEGRVRVCVHGAT